MITFMMTAMHLNFYVDNFIEDAIACNKFTLTSEGGARHSQANRLGQYVKEDTRTNGRASYRNYKKQQYLYWMNGYWLVGRLLSTFRVLKLYIQ